MPHPSGRNVHNTLYSQGRGVLRLNGSRRVAQKTLMFVRSRLAQGEPWIIQRYVDITYPVDVSPPWAPHALQHIDAHARFMVYATFDPTGLPQIIGGLGNFSRDWKVSGKSARLDEHGRIVGAAFNVPTFQRSTFNVPTFQRSTFNVPTFQRSTFNVPTFNLS